MQRFATILLLLLASGPAPQPAVDLERGRPIEREIRAGETHVYQVALRTGDFLRGTVEQRGISINIKGLFPDGNKIRSYSGPAEGNKTFRLVAEAAGAYRLELKAADSGVSGSYRIEIQQIQPMPERLKIAPDEENQSPRIAALRRELEAGHRAALADFWGGVEKQGTPLAEPIPGDDRNQLVTFLWRATFETHNVLVIWLPYTFQNPDEYQMSRLAETDLWYKTLKIRKGARFLYQLSPNDTLSRAPNAQRFATAQADPLNPRRRAENPNVTKYEVQSIAELPGAPSQDWANSKPGARVGKLESHPFRSTLLNNERKLSVYAPFGYAADGNRYGVLVLLDGNEYLNLGSARTTLDNLIAAGKIPPVVAVFVDNINNQTRNRELTCNPTFADFLHQELLPWVRQAYHLASDARQVTIGGVSYGGLAAAYAGLRHPESFGNILCQSGAFWLVPGQNPDDLSMREGDREPNFQHIGILSLEFHVDKLSRPLL